MVERELKNLHYYRAVNGAVILLQALAPHDDSAQWYPWAGVVVAGAGKARTRIYYDNEGRVCTHTNPFVDAQYDLVSHLGASAPTAERQVPEDREVSALQRLVDARARGVQEEIWVCRDGRRMLVGEMEAEHMRNTLRMLIRATRKKANARAQARQAVEKAEEEFWHDVGEDRKWGSE